MRCGRCLSELPAGRRESILLPSTAPRSAWVRVATQEGVTALTRHPPLVAAREVQSLPRGLGTMRCLVDMGRAGCWRGWVHADGALNPPPLLIPPQLKETGG
jgi:hypothetical protein